MSFRAHVKTEFLELELREVLQSSPGVLLGVPADAVTTLASILITTVYDLALATLFCNAARVVDAAANPASVVARFGAPPTDLIVPAHAGDALADLPGKPVDALVGVAPALALALRDTMTITSVRDLAQWPPYLAAVKLVTEAFAPERTADYDRERPRELIPRAGELAAHHVRYTSTVLIESRPSQKFDWSGDLIDVTSLGQVGFNDVAFGAIMHFDQTWSPRAVVLGQLLHSLPLAPGESTRLTVVDWLRRVAASTDEDQAQSEQLSSALTSSTAISEVTSAVAREFQSGDSVAGSASATASASTPGLLGLLGAQTGGGTTFGTAGTYSTSSGSRAVSAQALQSIDARTQQNSALTRTKRAAIVTEVSERDRESINTRVVINNNHMHALSIQYYEVVQTWETELHLDLIERCIFIPMRLVNFRNEQVIRRYLPVLVNAALDRDTRDMLLQFRHTVVLEFPFDRFADAALARVVAEAQTAVKRDTAAAPVSGPPALAADVEKLLLVQQVQARVRALRATLRAETDAAMRRRLVESYDRATQLRFELDRDMIVKSVAWDGSGISRVTLQLADGTASVLTSSGDRTSPTPKAHPQLGTGLPLDRLRSLHVSLDAAPNTNPSDLDIVRLYVLVQLRDRQVWLDFSFVASRAQASELMVLQAHPPVDVNDIANRLMTAQLHYSQSIWMRADRQALIMQLTPYECDVAGTKLRVVEWIDPVPVTVAGNYVAFRFTYEADTAWKDWKARETSAARPHVGLVPLPTGGVFAEAVMGEFNSAEKLDVTRFWKWQESPIPNLAPEISATQPGLHTKIAAPAVSALPPSGLSLQTPLALPTLGGSDALLKMLVVSNLFNDMSGADITKGLLKASIEASRDGDIAAAQQANDTLKAITDSLGKLLTTGGVQDLLKSQVKSLGSMFNLADKGTGTPGPATGGNSVGAAVNAGTAVDAGSTSGLGGLVAGSGADAIASIGGELGSVLEAVGPAAAALLA